MLPSNLGSQRNHVNKVLIVVNVTENIAPGQVVGNVSVIVSDVIYDVTEGSGKAVFRIDLDLE